MSGGARQLSAAPVWTPAANFAGGGPGLWLDFTSFSGVYQDAAGTLPATALGQPAGRVLDKSGRGSHISQPTTPARPTIAFESGIQHLTFDGLDDGVGVAFSEGVMSSDMDCFFAIKTTDTFGALFQQSAGAPGHWAGAWAAGDDNQAISSVFSGTPTFAVNGIPISTPTRSGLASAIATGQWVIAEARNVNMSSWTGVSFCDYGGSFSVNCQLAEVIFCAAGTEEIRAMNRQWLNSKVGASL